MSVQPGTAPLAAAFAGKVSLGLLLSSVGDVLLKLHDERIREDDLLFVGGLGAFLLGHVLYGWALSVGGRLLVLSPTCLPFYAGAPVLVACLHRGISCIPCGAAPVEPLAFGRHRIPV